MSNALSSFIKGAGSNLPALSDDQLADAIAAGQEGHDVDAGSGITYLNFSGKSGTYSIGRDRKEPDEDALYIVEPQALLAGWKCWKGGKPVAASEWSFFTPDRAIKEGDLEYHGPYDERRGEGWKKMLGMGMVTTDGTATSVKYTTTTISAINTLSDLIEEIRKRAAVGEPALPVIRLDAEEFTSRDGDTNWKPVFDVEAWVTRPAVGAFMEGAIDADQLISGEEPKKVGRRKK